MQYSVFTSAERMARAWLKSHGLQCHLCAPEKSVCHMVCTCLTLCCSRTCRSPRAFNLPHSLFRLPQHKNTQHNQYNMTMSKNTQYIMHISMLSQSTSSAIKNYSGVKTLQSGGNPRTTTPTQTVQNMLKDAGSSIARLAGSRRVCFTGSSGSEVEVSKPRQQLRTRGTHTSSPSKQVHRDRSEVTL